MICKQKLRINENQLYKRKALLEVSRGMNANDVILKKSFSNIVDEKYASKMLYKWKKEHFSREILTGKDSLYSDISNVDIDYELLAFDEQ